MAGFSDRHRAFTIGITTAEEVLPRVIPSIAAANGVNDKKSMLVMATITAVKKKHESASIPVLPNDLPRTLKSNDVPPSNRITTNAIVAISEPTLPKSAGVTIPNKGPITMPTTVRIKTSGKLVLRNCNERK